MGRAGEQSGFKIMTAGAVSVVSLTYGLAINQIPKFPDKRLRVMLSQGNDVEHACLFVYTINDAVFGIDSARPITGKLMFERLGFPFTREGGRGHFL